MEIAMKTADIIEAPGGFHLLIEGETHPLASLEELPVLIELLGVGLGELRFMNIASRARRHGDSMTIVDWIDFSRRNLRRLMIPDTTFEPGDI